MSFQNAIGKIGYNRAKYGNQRLVQTGTTYGRAISALRSRREKKKFDGARKEGMEDDTLRKIDVPKLGAEG